MGTDQSQVMNFWYEFDNNFNGSSIPSEVLNAYTGLFGSDFNRLFELLRSYGRNPKKDDLYRDALSQVREHIITLAQHQTKLLNTYFSDAEALEGFRVCAELEGIILSIRWMVDLREIL